MIGTLGDTIAAVASATGGAAKGIVRMSGSDTVACLRDSFRPLEDVELEAIAAAKMIPGVLTIALADRDAALPCDLFLWPTVKSYTRQPAAELHTFGSASLLSAALDTVCRAGARLAQPGEFTLRAFLAGRLDLVQAEAVLGVVDARDESQRHTALRQLAGGLSQPLGALRDELVLLLAELEAGLDFSDEDIEFVDAEEITRRLGVIAQRVIEVAGQLQARGEVGATFRAVLTGPPNVGKSSLFNALVSRYAVSDATRHPAIVSSQPGTTRDYLVAELSLDGVLCEMVDTAGADTAGRGGAIDRAAGDQTAAQRMDADLLLQCVPTDRYEADEQSPHHEVTTHDVTESVTVDRLCVRTKIDNRPAADRGTDRHAAATEASIGTSAITGEGIAELAAAIRRHALASIVSHGTAVATTAARCREALHRAAESLDRARDLAETGLGDELIASEIHAALHDLGVVVGRVYTDDILDQVFSSFCIGK